MIFETVPLLSPTKIAAWVWVQPRTKTANLT